MSRTTQNFIGGESVAATGTGVIEVVNPATEQVIGTVSDSNAADVDAAARAAHDALPGWAATTAQRRGELIDALADALERRGEAITALVTEQNGTPISFSKYASDIVPVSAYRYFAGLAREFEAEVDYPSADGTTTLVRREPVGVAALIVPWNGPLALLSWKLGPALAAGCTVVIKPAPETSLDMVYLAEAVTEAGIPPGVVNIVTGGRETGEALVAHPLVRKIAFTGSTAAGRAIGRVAGEAFKSVTLELGGKSAAILLEDADIEAFTANLLSFILPISGQVCYSQTRILAARSRYEEVIAALSKAIDQYSVGDPFDPNTAFGPVSSVRQYEKVTGYLRRGIEEGAVVAHGGLVEKATGYYVQPTVFRDVDNSMSIAREEIFGPVLVVIPFDTEDEAVAIANDSDYGLAGSVFTADAERGLALARRVETGTIGVNRYNVVHDAPFGGVKGSGVGRELGPESLDAYVTVKSIFV
ncbi:aldehyde dehydrogenase [Nocardia sp. R16R-3T]